MEIEKLSVKELISRFTVGQLWALIGVVAGLIAGSFGIGYKMSASVSRMEINSIQLEKVKLTGDLSSRDDDIAKLTAQNNLLYDKDRFLALYLRYQLAREKWNQDYDAKEEYKAYQTARDSFNKFITQRVDSEKLRIAKGSDRLATIKFDDGTIWVLPRELHIVAEE